MAALFEMHVRVGGDPRGFSEFVALHQELAKLSHPACPDVDWAMVEQLCLALFQHNGADLHSAAAFTLARSQRHGLQGMAQGVALIEALCREWPDLWPATPAARQDILSWLFARLQSMLRSLNGDIRRLPALTHLDTELLRLQVRLEPLLQISLTPLQALREQIESLSHRLQRNDASTSPVQWVPRETGPQPLMPIMIWPTRPMPHIQPARRRTGPWVLAVAAIFLLIGGGWWAYASFNHTIFFQQKPPIPASIRLDNLTLFDPGSAELKPDSTKILISALIDIKAQPGWLIVISGHADDRGSPELNLQLSQARALAVRGWMQRMGDIPDSCFAVQGNAASQPIASNDTQAGRAANRRVEISLVPQTGACARPA